MPDDAVLTGDRIDAGANLDGSMQRPYGRATALGVDRPFLLIGAGAGANTREPHNHRHVADRA